MAISSTKTVPSTSATPEHVAIIMDGNGRWASQRFLPRTAGHAKGVQSVRRAVETCGNAGVRYLTLFAFSSENWRRPADEVTLLMRLFVQALEREVSRLQEQGVRLRVVGDLSAFEPKLQELITQAQDSTAQNDALHLTIAANYGGRWDILQATRRMLAAHPELAANPEKLDEQLLSNYLSNFLIWQLAYTELFFTDCYWPDFGEQELRQAFEWYSTRERRFGRTSAQVHGTVKT
jgi:undecaprenyl diphosphate synthase